MLQSASTDTKKATARGNSRESQVPLSPLQAPHATVLSNRTALRLQRKCDCGGGPDCDCNTGPDHKKHENESPRTALHRKPAGASAILDASTESFFRGRAESRAPSSSASPIRIGAVNDPLEHEADRIADRVMRMPAPQPDDSLSHRQPSALFRKRHGIVPQSSAPPIVHGVLSSPGQPLDVPTRSFFEPRFGCDLSQVRIHTDTTAAQSAQSVDAHAWTVGRHIAFNTGMYSPSSSSGRALLAHELAHTLQQDARPFGLQRACRTGGFCAAPIKGDSGRFGEKSEREAEAARASSGPHPAGGGPPPCSTPRHKDPATSFTALASGEGATLPPEVSGIFIDACMSHSVAAQINTCAAFTDGTPPGADAAKNCIAVNISDEDNAAAILAKPTRSAKDNKTAREAASTVIHESQHSHFDAAATALVPAAADCDLNTVVFHGPSPAPSGTDYTVEFYLSEISAEIAEFTPYFQNFKNTGKGHVMFDEERNVTLSEGESILGDIKALQCKCECSTVDNFVAKVFADATSAWPADQKLEFQRAMTRTMPSFWPKALQKT